MLEGPFHELRVGAVSMMDFQARGKKTIDEQKKKLFDLYIRRHATCHIALRIGTFRQKAARPVSSLKKQTKGVLS